MMQAENIFKCFKIDTLIINRVCYKLGQLQYLVISESATLGPTLLQFPLVRAPKSK